MTVYHAPPGGGDCRKRYGLRSVVPATWNGKVIGAVELAADLGPVSLDHINQTFPGKWGIYNLKRGVRSIDDTHLVAFFGGDKDKSAGKRISGIIVIRFYSFGCI